MNAANSPRVGVMVSEVASPVVSLMAASAGLDFIIVDTEHGRFTSSEVSGIALVARSEGVECIVRVPSLTREAILRPLDAGAVGVMIPMITSVDQAESAVSWAKYPDKGIRGVVSRRPHTRYAVAPLRQMMDAQNEATKVWIQIEVEAALRVVDELARLEGVDALFIGPTDLSVSRGRPGELWTAEAIADYRTIANAARAAGLSLAIQLSNEGDWEHVADLGITHCSFGGDVGALVDGWTRGATVVRGLL